MLLGIAFEQLSCFVQLAALATAIPVDRGVVDQALSRTTLRSTISSLILGELLLLNRPAHV
jgi:hypothetical protein